MATHLNSLAKRARLNKGHVKAARVYKARVAALTFERAVLRDQMQNMTEEAVNLKSDLRHTTTVRARAEGREEKARDGLRVAEGELREVKDGLHVTPGDPGPTRLADPNRSPGRDTIYTIILYWDSH